MNITQLSLDPPMSSTSTDTPERYIIARECGNQYSGHLSPGTEVFLDHVIVNTTTKRMSAQVWTAWTKGISVPVGSVAGLREAISAGIVEIIEWTPRSLA